MRLVNDETFECSKLQGHKIEEFIGYYEGDSSNKVDMILLKLKGYVLWQRFFLDAGIGFWEEWDEADAKCDYEDLQTFDIASHYQINGKEVLEIVCSKGEGNLSEIFFKTNSLKLVLQYSNSSDMESTTIVKKL